MRSWEGESGVSVEQDSKADKHQKEEVQGVMEVLNVPWIPGVLLGREMGPLIALHCRVTDW